jgi:hypothetical protein
MRPFVSSIALAAFLLHSLFGCALHAHADDDVRCADHVSSACHSHEDGHDHHGPSNLPEDPCESPGHGPHGDDCVFAATVKAQALATWSLDLLPWIAPLAVEATVCSPGVVDTALARPRYLWGMRSHLAKSVLLN